MGGVVVETGLDKVVKGVREQGKVKKRKEVGLSAADGLGVGGGLGCGDGEGMAVREWGRWDGVISGFCI